MSGLHEAFDEIVADVPVYGDLDRAIEQADRQRRHRNGVVAGLVAAAAAVVLIVGVLALNRDSDDLPRPVGPPTPTPTRTDKPTETTEPATIPSGPSEVLDARMVGRHRLEVAGEIVPGRWSLEDGRRDVWVAGYSDEVGYMSPALWWGKGTTTHEVVGQRGGFAISQDARWIVWTRATSGGYDGYPSSPRAMEVVDTATGEVRWSRDADTDVPDIAALAVTNDGVVVFGHCLEPFLDVIGTPQCNDARIDVWAPRSGVTATVPAEVVVERGPAGTIPALTPLVQVEGMPHNGLLVRDRPSDRPKYVRVSARGEVEVVATLPRNTVAVTADERFALLATECADRSVVCDWSVLPLDGGELQPMPSLADILTFATDYDLPVYPYVVEHDDLLVVRDLGDYDHTFPALARCSLAEARCVRIKE
jgi:hypothetical protein